MTTPVSLYLSYYMRTGSILSTRYLMLLFVSYCTSMFLLSIFVYSKNKLSLSHKIFGDNLYRELSVIGISEILLKILTCCGFSQKYNPTVILTFRSKLVSYYLSNFFFVIQKYPTATNNTPNIFKIYIYSVYMRDNDSVMTCNREIPSIDNTQNKIHSDEFTSTYYENKNYGFNFCP